MNSNEYFFDKRKLKKVFFRYGIIFLIGLPILLGVSYLLEGKVAHGWKLTIMVLVGLVYVIICELILRIRKVNKEKYNEELRKIQIQREKEQMAAKLQAQISGENVEQNPEPKVRKKTTSKSRKKQKQQKQTINASSGRQKKIRETENEKEQ